jgi:hypothetical protein
MIRALLEKPSQKFYLLSTTVELRGFEPQVLSIIFQVTRDAAYITDNVKSCE